MSHPQWNDGYRADSGPSRGDPWRRGLRPIEASKAAVCYVRNTSIPDIRPLATLGRNAEALDWVGRSLALSSANPIALRHEIVLLEVVGRDDEARDAYRRYSALLGSQIRTIAELRARAMDAGVSGPSATFVEALRKAGMPEQ